MAQQQCGDCPRLHAEVARLNAEVTYLQRTVMQLQVRLGDTAGQIDAAVRLIETEAQKRTMPVTRLVEHIKLRLISAFHAAQGR